MDHYALQKKMVLPIHQDRAGFLVESCKVGVTGGPAFWRYRKREIRVSLQEFDQLTDGGV